jgi:hypothetical protein
MRLQDYQAAQLVCRLPESKTASTWMTMPEAMGIMIQIARQLPADGKSFAIRARTILFVLKKHSNAIYS